MRSSLLGWDGTTILDLQTGSSKPLDPVYSYPCGWDESGLFYYATWPAADHRFKQSDDH